MNKLAKQKPVGNTHEDLTTSGNTFFPNVDITSDEKEIILLADIPGVDEKSVDITLENNTLGILGKVAKYNFEGYTQTHEEFKDGDYYRTFSISHEIDQDKIKAEVKNGVLKLILPKIEPTTKKIEVKSV